MSPLGFGSWLAKWVVVWQVCGLLVIWSACLVDCWLVGIDEWVVVGWVVAGSGSPHPRPLLLFSFLLRDQHHARYQNHNGARDRACSLSVECLDYSCLNLRFRCSTQGSLESGFNQHSSCVAHCSIGMLMSISSLHSTRNATWICFGYYINNFY